jgi:hypothetical protein
MTKYDNTNKGVLFKNDRKDSDRHPDYTGNINVDGVEFWLSAWIKEGQRGKFMSLSIKPKEEQRQQPQQQQSISQRAAPRRPDTRISSGFVPLDDDIPFGPEHR